MQCASKESRVRRAARLTGCWVALAATLAIPARGFAESAAGAPQNEAKQALEVASEAYEHGRFDEALAAYERSYKLRPLPKALLGIARAAESASQPQRALESYQTYLRLYPSAFNRKQIEARVQVLSAAPMQASAPAPAFTQEPARHQQSAPAPRTAYAPQPAPDGALSLLPTEEILARQRSLQLQLTTGDGISLGAPITLLVLGLVTSGVGGALLAAGMNAEEVDDGYGGYDYESIKAVVIPGGALVGVGLISAVTGAVMIGVRRSRARGIRSSLSDMDNELRRRKRTVSFAPFVSTGAGSVTGLTGSVRF
ncbi:MAG: tetratricopeptide repeat protein [Polyangiales bacterium]